MSIEPQARVCPHCRFAYRARQGRCWLCGEPLPPLAEAPLASVAGLPAPGGETRRGAAVVENPYATPPSSVVGTSTFALSSLFLVVTLAAVCMGVIGLAPGLGIPLVVVIVPALFRTIAVSRRQADGREMSTGQKLIAFAGSVGIVVLILTAAQIALGTACFVTFLSATAFGAADSSGTVMMAVIVIGSLLSIGAALGVTIMLFRATWPKKPDQPLKVSNAP